MMCCTGCKCHLWKKIILGALILVNVFVWPQWLGLDGWLAFFAVLMVLGSIVHLVKPCECCCEMPKKKK